MEMVLINDDDDDDDVFNLNSRSLYIMTTLPANAAASFGRGNRFYLLNEISSLDMMREQQIQLQEENEGIYAKATEENRLPSEEELGKMDENLSKIENFGRQISIKERMENNARPVGNKTGPGTKSGGGGDPAPRTVPAAPKVDAGKYGFRSFGEFAQTVQAASGDSPDHNARTRLSNALTTYGNEGVGSDGGFAVPPDFRREIAEKVLGEQSLMARTDQQTTSSNSIVFPTDETTPWQTSGGVQAYWESEGGLKTQSKAVLGQNTIRLNKLIALIPVTDELLEDAPAIDGYLRRKVPDKFTAKLNTAIVSGTGVGQPKGILTSGALVTVAKETSQVADTIYFENIVKMVSSLYAPSMANAVWLVNQNVLPQLMTMQFVRTATSPVPVWMPATGISGSPYSTLMGRPVIPVQAMPTLGDLGDIVLADLTQYLTVTKGQAIRTDVSIHLFFDYDITTFRFVMRVAGQPWWDSTIVQQNAPGALGFFVALAERA